MSLEWERPGHVATVVGRADAPALAGEGHHERLAAASTQGTVESEAEDAAELAASGNGAGFKMGNTFTGVRHVVRNCVSIKNKAQGFYANHSHGGSDWFNNTAYANRGGRSSSASQGRCRNCSGRLHGDTISTGSEPQSMRTCAVVEAAAVVDAQTLLGMRDDGQ